MDGPTDPETRGGGRWVTSQKEKSEPRSREFQNETPDVRLSMREWDGDERLDDALRLGLVKSYGELDGRPIYECTLFGLQVERCLMRREPECATSLLSGLLASSTEEDARRTVGEWLAEDPEGVLPPPRPFEQITAPDGDLGRTRPGLREVFDELVDAGVLQGRWSQIRRRAHLSERGSAMSSCWRSRRASAATSMAPIHSCVVYESSLRAHAQTPATAETPVSLRPACSGGF